MKKLMKGLLAAMLCVSAAHATTHTNKSFLMPRPVLRNKAMESTTWHKQINKKNHSKFGGSLEATVFYERSENRHGLGKYFGFLDTAGDKTAHDTVEVGYQVGTASSSTPNVGGATPFVVTNSVEDLLNNDIYHQAAAQFVNPTNGTNAGNNNGGATPFAGTLRLRPRRSVVGARLDYFQDLEKLVSGLFFKVSTAVVNAESTMGSKLERSQALAATPALNVTVPGSPNANQTGAAAAGSGTSGAVTTGTYAFNVGDPNLGKTVANYFDGTLSNASAANITAALAAAKIGGTHNRTELADIELMVGYNFVLKDDKHVGLNLAVLFPTSEKPHGKYLFEPLAGQAGCWAFGAGLDTAFTLWKSDKKNLELLVGVDYRYIFENTQRRTVGLLKPDGTPSSHSWYLLMGQQGQAGLFPAANILNMPVEVQPGSQVNGMAALAFNCHNWTFDLGYELFAQEAECVTVKSWTESTYGVASYLYATNKVGFFNITGNTATSDAFFNGSGSAITKSQLDTNAAATSGQVTHKLFTGLGYAFNQWSTPLMIGLGGGYEWSDNNAALEQWSVYGKLGVSF